MKLFKKLGIVMIASLPVFFVSCSKEETEKPTYTETSEQQRVIGGFVEHYDPVEYYEYPLGGLCYNELSWKPTSGISYTEKYYTKVLNSWNDVTSNFDINSENAIYFNIDFEYYSIIACWVYAPNFHPTIKTSLTKSNFPNYPDYKLNVNLSYGMVVLPAVDNHTILISTPKIPEGSEVRTALSYGNPEFPVLIVLP